MEDITIHAADGTLTIPVINFSRRFPAFMEIAPFQDEYTLYLRGYTAADVGCVIGGRANSSAQMHLADYLMARVRLTVDLETIAADPAIAMGVGGKARVLNIIDQSCNLLALTAADVGKYPQLAAAIGRVKHQDERLKLAILSGDASVAGVQLVRFTPQVRAHVCRLLPGVQFVRMRCGVAWPVGN